MASIVVVSHSGYGHTARLADAVGEGVASAPGAALRIVAIDADGEIAADDWTALDSADAIVFGTPTYMGTVSWQFKKFADASSKRWFTQAWKDKLAAGFTNSASLNGDKHATLATLATLAMQHGMLWIGTGMMPANKKESQRGDVNYLGAFTGLMGQSPADAGADEAPPSGDLATARLFGARVAEAASRWLAGQGR